MSTVTVSWDRGDVERLRRLVPEKAIAAAVLKSGRDAIRSIRTASQRSVRFRKRLKIKTINDAMSVSFPKTKNIDSMAWTLRVSGRAIPLIEYPHTQTRRGISVAVNAGSRKLIKSAFVARMKSGHEGIFIRTGKGRLPIKELFSTRVTDVFNDTGMVPAVLEQGRLSFVKTFDRVLPLEIDKLTR